MIVIKFIIQKMRGFLFYRRDRSRILRVRFNHFQYFVGEFQEQWFGHGSTNCIPSIVSSVHFTEQGAQVGVLEDLL